MKKSKQKYKSLTQAEIKQRIVNCMRVVNSWEELHTEFAHMTDTAWIFRGVSNPEHYPIPSVGREIQYGPYKRAQEERLLQEFKHRAVTLIRAPEFDDWHWLAYAQHLGVPTRLLDWTVSPLVATFFALQSDAATDRAIFCMKYSKYIHEVDQKDVSPFDCSSEGRFSPPFVFDRLRAQRGLFTIHPHPTKVFYHEPTKVLRIPVQHVTAFRKALFKYGVDHWYIYPDAEGLGQQMRWHYRAKIGLGSLFMKKS